MSEDHPAPSDPRYNRRVSLKPSTAARNIQSNRRVHFDLPAIPEEDEGETPNQQDAVAGVQVEGMDLQEQYREDQTGWDDQQLLEAAGTEHHTQGGIEETGEAATVWGEGWAEDDEGVPFFSTGGETGFAVYRDHY